MIDIQAPETPDDVIDFKAGPLDFNGWLAAIDAETSRLTGGSTREDFPDWGFADAFYDGIEPVEAAHMMLAEDALGRGFLELDDIDPELVF